MQINLLIIFIAKSLMNIDFLIRELKRNEHIFNALLSSFVDDEDFITWKPEPGKWCLLEILCHLIDEEKEDFRTRVRFALENSTTQPPAIDPQNWVISRNYLHQNYSLKRTEFITERQSSISWLNSLKNKDWNAFFTHSKFGKFSAHFMLSNWLAHDYLHIKQITKLRYDYLKHISGENLDYAGNWT
jgi:hypothetical protein